MKKIFFAITAGAVLVLSSCNNEEANNKLKEVDAAAIQTAVDAKFAELQTAADAACQVTADSIATVAFDTWVAEQEKAAGKKPGSTKPKPKPTEPKKEEPKKTDPKVDVGQKGGDNKVDVGQKGTTNTKKIDLGQKK